MAKKQHVSKSYFLSGKELLLKSSYSVKRTCRLTDYVAVGGFFTDFYASGKN
ncbi:hypothetical protein [Brenneria alni]|uniref:hypothetical protein n=1 Tax=Brenneria alni TaxID=71656 RepID=UPI001472E04A|nr:hypothetical protein [Brenneria alni]